MKASVLSSILIILTIHLYGQTSYSDSVRYEYFKAFNKSQGWISLGASTVAVIGYLETNNQFDQQNYKLKAGDFFSAIGIGYLTNTLVSIIAKPPNRKRVCRKLGIPKALAKKWEKEKSHGHTYTSIEEYSKGGG